MRLSTLTVENLVERQSYESRYLDGRQEGTGGFQASERTDPGANIHRSDLKRTARYHKAQLPNGGTSIVAAIRSVANQYLIAVRSDDKIMMQKRFERCSFL